MLARGIIIALLSSIVVVLLYQFIYRDFAYRREVVAQRDSLLRNIRERGAKAEEIWQERLKCAAARSSPCDNLEAQWRKANDAERYSRERLGELHQQVMVRHGGLIPEWWLVDTPPAVK